MTSRWQYSPALCHLSQPKGRALRNPCETSRKETIPLLSSQPHLLPQLKGGATPVAGDGLQPTGVDARAVAWGNLGEGKLCTEHGKCIRAGGSQTWASDGAEPEACGDRPTSTAPPLVFRGRGEVAAAQLPVVVGGCHPIMLSPFTALPGTPSLGSEPQGEAASSLLTLCSSEYMSLGRSKAGGLPCQAWVLGTGPHPHPLPPLTGGPLVDS